MSYINWSENNLFYLSNTKHEIFIHPNQILLDLGYSELEWDCLIWRISAALL